MYSTKTENFGNFKCAGENCTHFMVFIIVAYLIKSFFCVNTTKKERERKINLYIKRVYIGRHGNATVYVYIKR